MPATYDSLATTTLGSAQNSITFSSISASYTDLRLIVCGTATATYVQHRMRLNGVTTDSYNGTYVMGTGASTPTSSYSTLYYEVNSDDLQNTIPSLTIFDFFSYANTTSNKTFLSSNSADNNSDGRIRVQAGLFRSTSAINSIMVYCSGGNWATGTTATLYGILRA